MKILYIMPRFHTNLAPTISEWKKNGHEVSVVTYSKGTIEDYSMIQPIVAGYSMSFKVFLKFYANVVKKNDPLAKNIALRIGIPPSKLIKAILVSEKPDLVILRERNMYTIVCNQICRKINIPTLLYNQSPIWASASFFKHDLAHRIVNSLTPQRRITPVNRYIKETDDVVCDTNAVFAPFVMLPALEEGEKKYFHEGYTRILEIGKYEERKNHFMMVDVFCRLFMSNKDIRLVIVGENSNHFHSEYFERLQKYISSKGMDDYVSLKCNLDRTQIADEYKKADVFVLPSTGEPAAISPLEAMSYSVPAISSSNNGTADYIVDGVTGYVFNDKDTNDLYEKLNKLVNNKDLIYELGKNAHERIKEYCSFEKYYQAIKIQMNLATK